MLKNDQFKRLLATWKTTGAPQQLVTFDVFYIATWVRHMQQVQEDFFEELEDNLLQVQGPEESKYLTHLLAKLAELPKHLAKLPTAAPTHLLTAFTTGVPFKYTAFYRQVLKALAAPGKSTATPPYDEEAVASPFQHEYVQASFLEVHARVRKEIELPASQAGPDSLLATDEPPFTLKVDMVDLVELLEIMQERGDWKKNSTVSRKVLCQRLAALIKLPPSKKGSEKPDWQRLYFLMGEREKDKSKSLTNRSKKGLYDAIKPSEA